MIAIAMAMLVAQDSKPSEYQVKAAYLYNFSRFVQWPRPAAKNEAFAVCVLGEDPFGQALDSVLAGETVSGSSVVARRISRPQDAAACRILFVAASESARLKAIIDTLDSASILTVSDLPQFTRRGGMVQFVLEDGKVHFAVNLASAERAGLILSSQLLKLAVDVRRN